MPVWEYKVISSGKGGFATPALMETFLNQLGKEEWEIIHFHTPPDNPLAFQGLARRTTQRDWTLEDAAAAAARVEAEKLRAEFEAKFKGGGSSSAGAEDKPETFVEQKAASDDGLRRLRDTDSDQDPDAPDEESPEADLDEWEKLAKEEDLPTFFEAIQPLMRRNQRGAGMSVGVDHLAKKWHMSEDDIMSALKECGFGMPEDEDDKPEYLEYDGDLFWVNVNRRGEYWVNTKEKPRPVFRTVKAAKPADEAPASETPAEEQAADAAAEGSVTDAGMAQAEGGAEAAKPEGRHEGGGQPKGGRDRGQGRALPEGQALLERIRPLMRRNRGGGSGSVGFLSRALRCRENDLVAAFQALGLTLGGGEGEAPAELVVGTHVWWLNKDNRGGIWINDRRQHENGQPAPAGAPADAGTQGEGSSAPSPANDPALSSEAPAMPSPEQIAEEKREEAQEAAAEAPAAPAAAPLPAALERFRPCLKETRSGGLAGEVGQIAEGLGQAREALLTELVNMGLVLPEKPREKTESVDVSGCAVWLSRNAKDELLFNVRPPGAAAEKRPRRSRRGPVEESPTAEAPKF